jgi:hypothetical protein
MKCGLSSYILHFSLSDAVGEAPVGILPENG